MTSTRLISIIVVVVVVVGGLFYLGSRGTGTIPILGTLTNLFGDSAPGTSGETGTESAGGAEGGTPETTGSEGNFITNLLNKLFDRKPDRENLPEGSLGSPGVKPDSGTDICIKPIDGRFLAAALPGSISVASFVDVNGGVEALEYSATGQYLTTINDFSGSPIGSIVLYATIEDGWTTVAQVYQGCIKSDTKEQNVEIFKQYYQNPNQGIWGLDYPGLPSASKLFSQETAMVSGHPALKIYHLDGAGNKIPYQEVVLVDDRIFITVVIAATPDKYALDAYLDTMIQSINLGALQKLK